MRKEDVISLFARIPLVDHPKVVVVMKGGVTAISLDTVMRQEPDYLVVRGREAGTSDEGRAFFVPYDEIAYVKIERLVRLNEIRAMYGEASIASNSLGDENDANDAPASAAAAPATVQSAAVDPASIAKQNLLDRIRAARTNAGTAKPAGK